MRFGIPDPDDSDGYEPAVLDLAYLSDESDDHVPDFSRPRMSKLGQSIRDAFYSSDSEPELDPESEDEIRGLLDGGYNVVPDKTSWREPVATPQKKKVTPAPSSRTRRRASVKRAPQSWTRWEPTVTDLLREAPSSYTTWIKETEDQAWHEGHRAAQSRRSQLREIEDRVRAEARAAQQTGLDREADELERMMKDLAVQQQQQEDVTARRFAERSIKLWADVDNAIKEAERKLAEENAARAVEERRLKDEEEARIAAAEKEALAKKAELERQAKEKAEKEAADKAAEVAALAKAEADKAEEEKKAAVAAQASRSSTEWAKWVAIQQRMKKDVIEVVKANKQVKTLRPMLGRITRFLGQVINSQEVILRVTNDIDTLLVEQLGKRPSAADPVLFDSSFPPTYGYMLSHTSKALIKQAENEVSAKTEAAFPLGRVVLGLILRGHGAFATVFFARLVKKCPWIIPHYPVRAPDQPREEYEKSTGRGTDESLGDYIARMGGIMTLYFAILQTPLGSLAQTLPSGAPTPEQLSTLVIEPFRLPETWTWLASALRPPLPGLPPMAQLLTTCLDIAGPSLLKWAGHVQISKLLIAIKTALDAGKITGDSAAARARLELLLDEWAKTKMIKAPKGRDWDP